jgi:hypothetical protein
MNAFVRTSFAISFSLVLALPPGACGAFARATKTEPAHKKLSCCRSTPAHPPCDSTNSPSKPGLRCCCSRDAALPEKAVQPTKNFDFVALAVIDSPAPQIGATSTIAREVTPLPSDLSLQVLLCVWRC